MMDWLLTPLSGSPDHSLPTWASWHARCMVASWGLLLPAGALIARFFKVTQRQNWPHSLDNKWWWHIHLSSQWVGVLLMSIGAWLAWNEGASTSMAALVHHYGGWIVIAAGWLQICGGLARGSKGGPTDTRMRGDHYDMTLRRSVFEYVHKAVGWFSLVTAVVVIGLGLFMADAPRWMLLTLSVWWFAFGFAFWRLQRAGRCMDTYQAIWGPSLLHPVIEKNRLVGAFAAPSPENVYF